MNFVKPLSAIALVSVMAPVEATTVYDFQTAMPDAGTSVNCPTADDLCANAPGLAMTFSGGAVAATGYYMGGPATSMLDNFSDRPSGHSEWKWVGLGVYHNPNDPSDDNITNNEKLVLKFASAVVLSDVMLRAEGHYANFETGSQFAVSSGAGPMVNFSFADGQNNYNIANDNLTMSDTWTFYGLSDDARKQYYLSTVTAVPEPEAYGLALAGMGVVAFMLRRRKQQA